MCEAIRWAAVLRSSGSSKFPESPDDGHFAQMDSYRFV